MLSYDKKFGYYRVNLHDKLFFETSSKLEALEVANRSGGYIHWDFNDEYYSAFDWTEPVTESINELYAQRAQQLREKYDHIVLLYSGGYDSANILKTFMNNDIHIDCIATFYSSLDQDNLVDNALNIEWAVQTWPKLQKILPRIPQTEFARVDLSELSLDSIDQSYGDYLYKLCYGIAPNNLARPHLLNKLNKKYQDTNTCILYGVDKPRLRYQNGCFIFNFYDAMTAQASPHDSDTPHEWFYWTPDMPKIAIKQAQIVKHYWQWAYKNLLEHPKNKNNQQLGILLDQEHIAVQKLIYPYCADELCLTFRPLNPMIGSRDQWVWRSNTEHAEKLKKIVEYFYSCPKEWFHADNQRRRLVGSISRDYLI